MSKRVVIVGGVAGGMSCAARLRRLDESLNIVVFEKGNDVSFANCGMPYYIGGVIPKRSELLVQTPQTLRGRYDLDIRPRHEVVRVDRPNKRVEVKNLQTGETFFDPYDTLVLSPGAAPFRPEFPGSDQPNVFVLNDLADMDAINAATAGAKSVCVVGGGFIGVELIENFTARGLKINLVEMLDQLLPPMDWEMTQPLLQQLKLHDVRTFLGATIASVDGSMIKLAGGHTIDSDFVVLAIGVRPSSRLAADAGLDIGPRGHIKVDAHMRTSDPDIYAVGDVGETTDYMTGEPAAVPLAGPANRQGRIAADNICGHDSKYRGTQGTAIVKLFDLAAASTGMSEKRLKAAGKPYRRVFLHPFHHAKYYPGAAPVSIKLLFSPDGQIYGAQIVGSNAVDSLINVIATAIRGNLTVQDLEHLELAYSPQWGSAKHAINMAGFLAANVLKGDVDVVEPEEAPAGMFWLDVRTREEAEAGSIPGSVVIPVDELRQRVGELPRDKEIAVFCAVGLRGYIACRYLRQHGFKVRNYNGGYRTWCMFHTPKNGSPAPGCCGPADKSCAQPAPTPLDDSAAQTLDVSGMQCPGPIVQVKQAVEKMQDGDIIDVISTDPGFAADIPMWCSRTGNTLVGVAPSGGGKYVAKIQKGGQAGQFNAQPAVGRRGQDDRPHESAGAGGKTIVCFSNDLDKAMATFIIANGAAAMGSPVTIFFTFWGLNILRKPNGPDVAKGLLDRMFGMMMPKGAGRLRLSKLNMGGFGTLLMKHVMKSKNVMDLPALIKTAQDAGVRLVACAMTMDIMGIKKEELIDGVEIAGVANYLGTAETASVNLFI